MNTLYGIHNCDSIKKAVRQLQQKQLEWQLHDYREQGLDDALLQTLMSHFTLDVLVNRRSTTWRQLSDAQQQGLVDGSLASALLLQYPTLIKRPILHTQDEQWLLGLPAIESWLVYH